MKTGKKKKLLIAAAALTATAIAVCILIESTLRPNLMERGEAMLTNTALRILSDATAESIDSAGDLAGLVHVEKDKDGNITLISTDSARINDIAGDAATIAQDAISCIDPRTISIPFGDLTGIKVLSGWGPRIKINAQPIGSVRARFKTALTTAGINQICHRTFITLTADMRMIVGGAVQSVSVESDVLVSECIIVGAVPETYADVMDADEFMNLIP